MYPYRLSKPDLSFSTKRSDTIVEDGQTDRTHHLLPSLTPEPFLLSKGKVSFLENSSLSVVLQKEGDHRENKKRTLSFANQTLPFKNRKWLWRSTLKKDFRAEAGNEDVFVENKTEMMSTCLLEQIFFKSNVSALDVVSSDEEGVNINPLKIDLYRPDTP